MTSKGRVSAHLARVLILAFAFSVALPNLALADDGGTNGKGKGKPGPSPMAQIEDPGAPPSSSYTLGTISCIARSDYPHKSAHVSGTVDAEGWSTCTAPMSIVQVTAKLYKHLFFVFWWEMGSDGNHQVSAQQAYSRPWTNCAGDQLYMIVSTHTFLAPTGEYVNTQTEQQNRVNC